MPFGLGDLPLVGDIWSSRPKPLSSLWGGAKGGGLWGAAAGATAAGPPGAAVGAAVGIALGTVAVSAQRLHERMQMLERTTRSLIDQYKRFDPAITRMRHQWQLLERRLNRAWAQTIAPTLKKLTDIGTEFKERWERMKIDFFRSIEPFLQRMLDIFRKVGRITLGLFEQLQKALSGVLSGLGWLGKKLGWLDEGRERGLTQRLSPYTMDWPTVEGPLTGAMRRAGLAGPPFTTEEARRAEKTEPGGPGETQKLYEQGMLQGQPGAPAHEEIDKPLELPLKIPGVSVNVNVGDSKELAEAFERVWHQAAYELRKLEAEDFYRAFELQSKGTYV